MVDTGILVTRERRIHELDDLAAIAATRIFLSASEIRDRYRRSVVGTSVGVEARAPG
jgi:hypothetical protein